MEFQKAKIIVQSCDWSSWGNLDYIIERHWENSIDCTDSEKLEIRKLILDKIDELATSLFEPYYSLLLELKGHSGEKRYKPEDIYLEFPGRHDILYLRNQMRLNEEEQVSRRWKDDENHTITLFRPEYSSKESIASQFFNGISNRLGKEYMFLTDGRLNLEFVLDCGKESGATLTDIIEISEPYSFGLIYRNIDYSHRIGSVIQMYSLDEDNRLNTCRVDSRYLDRGLSAKFFCKINDIYEQSIIAKKNRNSERHKNNEDNTGAEENIEEIDVEYILQPTYERQWVDGKYSCMDYSSPHKPDRRFSGSLNMKACFTEYKSKQSFNSRVAKSPAIIVDTDSYSTFAYFWKDKNTDEHMQQPFVLDDHFLAYKLSDDYMSGEQKDSRRYKTAVDQINKRLEPFCNKVARRLSDIPGKPYHLNFEEKRYILDVLSGEIIKGSFISKGAAETPMILDPCGFDLKPYLDKLVEEGFVCEVRTNENVLLRYRKSEHASYIALTLFAYIMNNKIAESYSSLDRATKELWNERYNYNGWKYGKPEGNVSHYEWREMDKNKEQREFKDSYPANTGREKTLKLSEKGFLQIRGRYFEHLFSMKEGQIKTLKSAAVSFDELTDRNMERQHIIHLILEVEQLIEKDNICKVNQPFKVK